MQKVFDELYASSKNGNNFYKLYELIISKENILLAYRNIKTNNGSHTAGVDGKTIDDISRLTDEEVINRVRNKLMDYKPQAVRRVYIPKRGSDKKRPLGIPTIWDRLIQQCILQVLEPVCEPKFHNHSYGFRANRSCEHAISRAITLVNLANHHYCVDVDIKGFFDNVNHGKLLKQMWTLGIRDKRVISIISKMLKAEIAGEGIPSKGTPQGGLISPLLSLIVLNELDWWVSSQWETFKPERFNTKNHSGWFSYARKYTRLKDGFIVRYADDFKIMCRTYAEAKRYYYATIDFLKCRLGLEISEEKSKVVNLKKNSSNFLGFKMKSVKKGKTKNGYVVKTDMSNKAIEASKQTLKHCILDIKKDIPDKGINKFNATVMGIQNYYCIATNIYNNLTEVNYAILPSLKILTKGYGKKIEFRNTPSEFKDKTYGIRPDTKIFCIGNKPLLPVTGVKRFNPMNFSQTVCDFTEEGRKKIHENLKHLHSRDFEMLYRVRDSQKTIDFNDNLISAYVMQDGLCYFTHKRLNLDNSIAIYKNPKAVELNAHTNICIIDKSFHKTLSFTKEKLTEWIAEHQLSTKTQLSLWRIYNLYNS
ncbi:MAG: group II intron reverse transcriptase/maturase [Anaerovoracaceae bacterium]